MIIIGSQSILGSYTEDQLPPEATMSPEVDIAPMDDDDANSLEFVLNSQLGEWSPFHVTHGFYVEGVGKRTAILPADWEYRLVAVRNENTKNATGLCLDPHDLCAAKLMANREKDFDFVLALIRAGLIDRRTLVERLGVIDLQKISSDHDRTTLAYRLDRAISWASSLPEGPAQGADRI